MRLTRTLFLALPLLCLAQTSFAGQPPAPSQPPPGNTQVQYAVIPSKSYLDERKNLFSLGLAVAIDWKKVPQPEKKRLVPLITKDVRLRNCVSVARNPKMIAFFKRSGAKMKISVVDAHGVPMLSTVMTLKNCPLPRKG